MLIELRIENFAIIDQLELKFGPGFIVFTGETGAGKSIIIDAVETLLGVRADTSFIRSGVERSTVEGTFRIQPKVRAAVHALLEKEELLDDPDHVTMSREFRREGRNVVRVNGRTANLALLGELGQHLIDLHGQSQHLSLLRVPSHLGLLDRFADSGAELGDYQAHYQALMQVREELKQLRAAESDAERRAELLAFQVNEVQAANLKAGEEEELREERTRLANAESLATLASAALAALDDTSPEAPAASDRLGEAAANLVDLAKIDAAQEKMSERAQELLEGVADITGELRDYLESVEFNPRRLEEVEERLDLLHNLKRKYGASIQEILAFGERAQAELEGIEHAEERLQELELSEGKMLGVLAEKALALSTKRHTAADELSRGIETELEQLRMQGARFGVDFQRREHVEGLPLGDGVRVAFDANGFERVEFLVEPNPGEGLKPLVKIASGGETARLMLALKNVLAKADETPTLIFDEIDQGIGGRVGAVVGQKLWNLGREHQVLCITHLPQLAGFGEQHFKVTKEVQDGRTVTQVHQLDGEERMIELAQMLGEVSEGTLQSANEIMQAVAEATAAQAGYT